jgi:hypothetical protein
MARIRYQFGLSSGSLKPVRQRLQVNGQHRRQTISYSTRKVGSISPTASACHYKVLGGVYCAAWLEDASASLLAQWLRPVARWQNALIAETDGARL